MQVIRILSINRGKHWTPPLEREEGHGKQWTPPFKRERERQEGAIYFWDVNLEVILKSVSIQNLAIFLEENLPFYRVSSSWP